MLPSKDIVYILISATTFALYSVLTRKAKKSNPIIFLFWIHTINYLGFLGVYFYRKFVLLHDVFAIEELISQFTFSNSPLYLVMGFTFLGTFLIYANLITHYPVSQVLPFIQISLLFTMASYMLLGNPFSAMDIIGIIIVCFGAVLSALDEFPTLNLWHHIKKIPRALWVGVLFESMLIGLRNFITFLLTQDTPIDKLVMENLKHVFPFSFQDPFYFNVGARYFVIIIFLAYILHSQKKDLKKIFTVLSESFGSR